MAKKNKKNKKWKPREFKIGDIIIDICNPNEKESIIDEKESINEEKESIIDEKEYVIDEIIHIIDPLDGMTSVRQFICHNIDDASEIYTIIERCAGWPRPLKPRYVVITPTSRN